MHLNPSSMSSIGIMSRRSARKRMELMPTIFHMSVTAFMIIVLVVIDIALI